MLRLKTDEHILTMQPLLRKFAHLYVKNHLGEYDDCLQDCYMVYLTACDKFDDTRKTKFSSYLYKLLENNMYKRLREFSKRPRIYSLDETSFDEDNLTLLDTVKSHYVVIEGDILNLVYQGHTIKQIADIQGVSERTIYRRLKEQREDYYG
jgi:RNA polymerase sigma factor (sigma-70 family)